MGVDPWPAIVVQPRDPAAFPLRLRQQVIGALNMFGTDVGRIDPDDVRTVQALADVATIGLLQERAVQRGVALSEQLQGALNSRVIIEQAKGAIAQMRSCTVDEAFIILRDYCQAKHLRVTTIAHDVITDAEPTPGLTTP